MQPRRNIIARMALTVGFVLIVLRSDAYAYLDAGTGSLILQGLVAGAMAAAFFFRQRWADVKSWISGKRATPKEPPTDASEEP